MYQRKNIWIIHVLGWLLFIILPLTIMSREPDTSIYFRLLTSGSFWLFFLVYALVFYANILVLIPKLFLRQYYTVYAGIFIVGFITIYFTQPFENLIFQKYHQVEAGIPSQNRAGSDFRVPPPRHDDFQADFPPPRPKFDNYENNRTRREGKPVVDFISLVLFVVVWVAALATKISEQWRLSEKRAILSEADKAQAELSFFKAQINPHFLFNTLNNIYALAVSQSENTAPSIMKLSKMMRYITEEATENFVPLEDEIICLENYIDLQRLRLNAKTKVNFIYEGQIENRSIAPLILMTFVENAFKYGVSNRYDNTIEIEVKALEDKIWFHCKNQIFEMKEDNERKGIGLANTRKRLDFLYPARYKLDISDEDDFFNVNLELW